MVIVCLVYVQYIHTVLYTVQICVTVFSRLKVFESIVKASTTASIDVSWTPHQLSAYYDMWYYVSLTGK